jgi:vacuolar-type H+-ATPase subunit B/Vma2
MVTNQSSFKSTYFDDSKHRIYLLDDMTSFKWAVRTITRSSDEVDLVTAPE